MRPAQGWDHAHRTAGEHGSEGRCVRRLCPMAAQEALKPKALRAGLTVAVNPRLQNLSLAGVVGAWCGRGGARVAHSSGVRRHFHLWLFGRLMSPLLPRGQITVGIPRPPQRVRPLVSASGPQGSSIIVRTARLTGPHALARDPHALQATCGLGGARAPRTGTNPGEAGVPAFCRSLPISGDPGT